MCIKSLCKCDQLLCIVVPNQADIAAFKDFIPIPGSMAGAFEPAAKGATPPAAPAAPKAAQSYPPHITGQLRDCIMT